MVNKSVVLRMTVRCVKLSELVRWKWDAAVAKLLCLTVCVSVGACERIGRGRGPLIGLECHHSRVMTIVAKAACKQVQLAVSLGIVVLCR